MMKNIFLNKAFTCESKGWSCRVFHKEKDAPGIYRLVVFNNTWEVELLPSKGFSVGQILYRNQALFWEAPTSLTDPDRLDLNDDSVRIEGEPAPGFSFLKTFASGIELYGMRNWGMPHEDPQSGQILPLHGESSNIPVAEASIELSEDHAWISASFIYRSFTGDPRTVWHQRGEKLFEITRTLKIPRENGKLEISDRIENLTDTPLVPDWGYHITFRPEQGDRLILPSRQRANRDGGELPKDVESWIPAKDEGIRTETGILHKGLLLYEASEGPFQGNTRALFKRANPQALPKGILLSFPLAPYTQSWSCSGGAGSKEFTLASGQPLFEKSWNGSGIEIGASALDHDGNTDAGVSYEGRLHPGESLTIPLELEMLEAEETERLEKEIRSYIVKK